MSIDNSKHSIFGASKVAADVTVKTDINYVLSGTRKPHTNYKESV